MSDNIHCEQCEDPVYSKGMCKAHYYRDYRKRKKMQEMQDLAQEEVQEDRNIAQEVQELRPEAGLSDHDLQVLRAVYNWFQGFERAVILDDSRSIGFLGQTVPINMDGVRDIISELDRMVGNG